VWLQQTLSSCARYAVPTLIIELNTAEIVIDVWLFLTTIANGLITVLEHLTINHFLC